MTLEILDAAGAVLRRYSSNDPTTPTAEELRTNLIPPYWPKINGPLPVTAGMHRWVWDLRATAPASPHYDYPISAVPGRTPLTPQGPTVLPGTYTVRLTVDGHSETQPLTVKMDPRIPTSPADLETLHAAEVAVCSAFDAISKADLAAHSVQEQLAAPENAALAAQLAPYTAALKKLLTGAGAEGDRQEGQMAGIDAITGAAGQVYGELDQSDEAPTEALLAAAATVEKESAEAGPAWEDFEAKQLPAINDLLRKAGRPAINPTKAATDMPDSGDED